MSDRRVRIGGLMRCCLGTLEEYTGPEEVGTTLTCMYCKKPTMVVAADGVWEWVGRVKARSRE